MTTLGIYLWDKKEQLKRMLRNGGSSLKSARTWQSIYMVFVVFSLLGYFITFHAFWLQIIIVSFAVFLFMVFWLDYSSGRHVGRWRKVREEKWRKMQEEKEASGNSQ